MIRFEHVTKLYPGNAKPALNGTNVEIKAGEFVFLVGASGSGKSSFLRLVLKEDKPTSGEIHVLGQRLSSVSSRKIPYFRRSLGVVFQDFRLLPGRTVYQNVAFTLQVLGKSRGFIQEAVPDVLKMVGLENKSERLPHELSGGEQQRVAIARAVVNKPAILLADEPTGNLDPATSAGIMQVLELINAGGTTVVMATHDVGIVDSMKRRVIELIGGDIVRDEVEGGYTTSIPIQRNLDVADGDVAGVGTGTFSLPATAAVATAAAVPSDDAPAVADAPLDLPTSPRTVVETTPHVEPEYAEAVPVAAADAPAEYADEERELTSVSAESSAGYGERPPVFGRPLAYPGAVPTITGVIPRLDEYSRREPTAPAEHVRPVESVAASGVAASSAAASAVAPPAPSAPVAPVAAPAPAAGRRASASDFDGQGASPSVLSETGEIRRLRGRHSTGEAPTVPAPGSVSRLAADAGTQPGAADDPGAHLPPTQPISIPTGAIPPAQDPLRNRLTGQMSRPVPPTDEAALRTDGALDLAVRLGLRRPDATPESAGSQEVGPTS